MNGKKEKQGFGTTCVQNNHVSDKKVYSHREAIYPTSAFTYSSTEEAMALFDDREAGYIYARWNNPTVEAAARTLESLETHGSDMPVKGRLFGSGMAAIAAVLMAHLKPGDAILTQDQLYGGTDELLRKILEPWGISRVRTDLNNTGAVADTLEQHPEITLVYCETPSNPMLHCTDLTALSKLCKHAKIPLAVDNTFCTPYLQQPVLLGADYSIYSTTKFLNGHGNAIGGAVVGSNLEWMNGPLFEQLKLVGGCASAFDAWLLVNGLKTLEIRMERHCSNAVKVAEFLEQHPAVASVNYLGLKSHPQFELAAQQMRAPAPMISFELKGGLEAGKKLMNEVKICVLATTLGTVDTLVQHPASMTHAPVPVGERLAQGITDGLVRMSVGIENQDDIIADLDQALG